jgi:N-carbamoyl-L-amino-acid hydrolase
MIGSHLDTQTPGGKFDGPLGVLAGLEFIRALNRSKVTTTCPVEIVNWTNEEGVRWPGMMGSSVYAGQLKLDTALAFADRQGLTVSGELARIGYGGEAPVGGRDIDSYLELHIEQGSVLEDRQILIGAVTNSSWWGRGVIEIHGENGHAQTAPMSRRRNALVGAAKLILGIEAIGASHEPDGIVSATVIDCWPNNWVNIPHLSKISFLIVHATNEGRQDILDKIAALAASVAKETKLSISNMSSTSRDRLDFSEDLLQLTEGVAKRLGYSSLRLPTLAGHDALNMHFVCPTAIIFVPCRAGISHSEFEWCEPDHAIAGARVLLNAALARAGTS